MVTLQEGVEGEGMKRSILVLVLAAAMSAGCVTTQRSMHAKKLDSIIIPEMIFREVDMSCVAEFLADSSRSLDEEGQGVNIVLMGDAERKVSISLRNVSLGEALSLVCEMAGLEIEIRRETVVLRPATKKEECSSF